jgi:hypothetical protein
MTILNLLLLAGCRAERWEGVFYPDASNLPISIRFGEFSSFAACRRAGTGLVAQFGIAQRYADDDIAATYECGRNCRPHESDSDIHLCDETRD